MDKNEKQQRDTKQRRLVYECVAERFDHPNANDIYLDVHSREPHMSKATVYRNLKVLSENGDILHVKVPGADRYDSTLSNHYHVLCTECGTVIDAPIGYAAENDGSVADSTGFVISRHRTVFEGVCPECQKKRKG